MGYNYNYDIATSRTKVILKLFFRWRGSVWQAVWVELVIWLALYAMVSVIYRLLLTQSQQITFEHLAMFCDARIKFIPLDFMLSFFVTTVVNRWVIQFSNIGMVDHIALFTSSLVRGADERGRQLRRNIVRYCVLSQAIVFRDIHLGVRKRFPTLDTLVSAGFMMKHEQAKYEECKSRYPKYWLPFNWALHLLEEAKNEKRVDGTVPQSTLATEIRNFQQNLTVIWNYDWAPLPLMYPQLVYLAVHAYFLVTIIARQFIINPNADYKTELDIYVPFMSILEFIFYMGWLKVAMALLNPFGDDEEDVDCNFLLDRNLSIALAAVDETYDSAPALAPDVFYNDTVSPLYSEEAAAMEVNFYVGTANRVQIPKMMTEVTMLPHPVNEKIDRFLHNTARNNRIATIPLINESNPLDPVKTSLTSQLKNIFRRRKISSISSDLSNISQNITGSGNGKKTKNSSCITATTFVNIDAPGAERENNELKWENTPNDQ